MPLEVKRIVFNCNNRDSLKDDKEKFEDLESCFNEYLKAYSSKTTIIEVIETLEEEKLIAIDLSKGLSTRTIINILSKISEETDYVIESFDYESILEKMIIHVDMY